MTMLINLLRLVLLISFAVVGFPFAVVGFLGRFIYSATAVGAAVFDDMVGANRR